MRMRFRRRKEPHYHDMRNNQPQYIETTDGDRSSVRSSEDGASGSPGGFGGEEREKLEAKINAAKEKLKRINLIREGDVEHFLSMSKNSEAQRGVDNPQMARIRQSFEKQNKKHAQETEVLQKKLIIYEQRLAELDSGILIDTPSKNVISKGIRRTGANIKGMTESVMNAPYELAHKLFGSADNVNDSTNDGDDSRVGQSVFYANSDHGSIRNSAKKQPKSSTLPAGMKMDAAALKAAASLAPMEESPARLNVSKQLSSDTEGNSLNSTEPSTERDPPQIAISNSHDGELLVEIRKMRQQMNRLEEKCDKITHSFHSELGDLNRALDEERFKVMKLEELVNETIVLYQAEFSTVKNTLTGMDYQNNDRFRKMAEVIEASQNQMIRMETSFKQTLDLRARSSVWTNGALLSGVNVLVELLKICLYLVATVLDVFRPFTGSRNRSGILLLVLIIFFFVFQRIDFSALFSKKDVGSGGGPSLGGKEL